MMTGVAVLVVFALVCLPRLMPDTEIPRCGGRTLGWFPALYARRAGFAREDIGDHKS